MPNRGMRLRRKRYSPSLQMSSNSSRCTCGNGSVCERHTIEEVTYSSCDDSRSSRRCKDKQSSYQTRRSDDCYERVKYVTRPIEEGAFEFRAMLVPVSNVTLPYSSGQSMVQFMIRRKNKVMTMQWEPFSCQLQANGVAYIVSKQSLSGLPPYPIDKTVRITYNGAAKVSFVRIDPNNADVVCFYLDLSGAGISNANDTYGIGGGIIEWITE